MYLRPTHRRRTPRFTAHSVEHYKTAHQAFKYVSRFVLLLGSVIPFAVMSWIDHSTFADDGYISELWPVAYGVIQFLPLMAVEFSEFRHFKK